ncbi:hypothetical protein CVT23_18220 [Minwuia thermotolerans]|uniref:Uncharacterized protein n=2 Tax=Minwuia thermotolerans TaxID=2056226 RepID=A0A2M9FXW8_9PROT|nr:hypothetical protein CVT23_18220 [Minwuia thermotolerans]
MFIRRYSEVDQQLDCIVAKLKTYRLADRSSRQSDGPQDGMLKDDLREALAMYAGILAEDRWERRFRYRIGALKGPDAENSSSSSSPGSTPTEVRRQIVNLRKVASAWDAVGCSWNGRHRNKGMLRDALMDRLDELSDQTRILIWKRLPESYKRPPNDSNLGLRARSPLSLLGLRNIVDDIEEPTESMARVRDLIQRLGELDDNIVEPGGWPTPYTHLLIEELIPVWKQWTGRTPRRSNATIDQSGEWPFFEWVKLVNDKLDLPHIGEDRLDRLVRVYY